jgi:hypothetical protein
MADFIDNGSIYQPFLTKGRNQWAKMLIRSSAVKIAEKNHPPGYETVRFNGDDGVAETL